MKNIKIITVVLLITSTSFFNANGKEISADEFIIKSNKQNSTQISSDEIEFNLLANKAEYIFNQNNQLKITDFPLMPGFNIDMVLKNEMDIVDNDLVINTYDESGVHKRNMPTVKSFIGNIVGQKNSKVILNYSKIGLIGFIQDTEGNTYNITPQFSELGKSNLTHSVINSDTESELDNLGAEFCGVSDHDENINKDREYEIYEDRNKSNVIQKERLLEVKFAVDANFEYFLKFCEIVLPGTKSTNQWNTGERWFFNMKPSELKEAEELALTYINSVISSVSRIFEDQTNITLKLADVNLYKHYSACPYYSMNTFGSNLGTKLSAVSSIWNNKSNPPHRALTTVFTDVDRQPSGANTLGIAYVGGYNGTLCSNQGYSAIGISANTSFPTVKFSKDVQVTAHEFGHNFGSPHTHNCRLNHNINAGLPNGATIDSCVTPVMNSQYRDGGDCLEGVQRRVKNNGTIMSYCHIGGSIIYEFHPAIKKHIRNRALILESSNCSLEPSKPIVKLVRPIGNENLFKGEIETIKFVTANVVLGSIYYSSNNGETWELIDDEVNLSATDEYKWKVPEELNNLALIKIQSNVNPSVFDQSIVTFNVTTQEVNSVFPEKNQNLGYLEPQKIVWKKLHVDSVNVSYSLDNGQKWSEIVSNFSQNSVEFDFPNVYTDDALLKVEASNKPNINTIIPFNLGEEKVVFGTPSPGETYCKNELEGVLTFNFEREFVNDFDIFMSRDEGETWERITNFANRIDTETNTFDWKYGFYLQEEDTLNNLLVKAVLKSDNDVVIGEISNEFQIKQCVTSIVGEFEFDNRFKINNISPNPATNDFMIKIYNGFNKTMEYRITIVDGSGKPLYNTGQKYINSEYEELNLSTQDLPSGSYFIILESEKYNDVQQLHIIR